MWRFACLGLALVGCRYGFAYATAPDASPGAGPDADATVPDAMIAGCASAGSVACYGFDNSGSDSAGGNDATTTGVTYGPGRVRQGVHLDASSTISAADSAAEHLATAGTIAAWVLVDSLPVAGARSIVVDTNNYGLDVQSNGDVECFYTGTHHIFAAGLVVGTWAHVACTYDGSAVKLWKDGELLQSQPDSGSIMNNAGTHLQIGSNIPDSGHPGPDLYLGMLDEVGLWNVALTAADVCALAGGC